MKRGAYFLVLVAALAAAATGCGRSQDSEKERISLEEDRKEAARSIEKAIEEEVAGRVRVDIADGRIEIQGIEEGKDFSFTAGGKVAVPKDFPEDIPLYPEAVVRLAQQKTDWTSTVILGTSASFAEAVDFTRRRMAEEGWVPVGETELEGQQFLSYRKEKRDVAVTVSPEKEETVISIVHMKRW